MSHSKELRNMQEFIRGQLEGFWSNAAGTKCLIVSQVVQSAHLNA